MPGPVIAPRWARISAVEQRPDRRYRVFFDTDCNGCAGPLWWDVSGTTKPTVNDLAKLNARAQVCGRCKQSAGLEPSKLIARKED
jgi:hypothetical protein